MNTKPLYDWQDKDGQAKLQKILTKLLDNGYNARMTNNKMFVEVYNETSVNPICSVYSSTWHSLGLLWVFVGYTHSAVCTTFSADEAYDMLIEKYKEVITKCQKNNGN